MTHFKENLKVLRIVGGNLTLCHKLSMGIDYKNIYEEIISPKDCESLIKLGKEAFKSVFFLMGGNYYQYG